MNLKGGYLKMNDENFDSYANRVSPYSTISYSQKRLIRQGFDLKCTVPDYFELFKISDDVIDYIFNWLTLPDLVHAMCACRRFNRIGKKSKSWRILDLSSINISHLGLHKTLERQTSMLSLTSSVMFKDSFNYLGVESLDKLVYLDLSYVSYTDPSILGDLLNRTQNLQLLNIAQFPAVNNQLCMSIGKNKQLKYLNMEMCEQFTANNLSTILSSCDRLVELNLGWSKFVPNALKSACPQLPVGLKRLNLSGMGKHQLTNDVVELIVDRCKDLVEVDFSDCSEITETALISLNGLENLEKLSLCRCHEIDPLFFADIENFAELNVYGNITDEGYDFLKHRLNPTTINGSCFSTIARISLSRFQRLR